jgi:plastocyanin
MRNNGAAAGKDFRMLRTFSLATLVAFATPAAAQPIRAAVDLSNFKFTPSQVELKADLPIILQLRNNSAGGHSFSAPAFFAAARVDPASAKSIREGRVEVPAHASVEIALTPASGRYPLNCSHTFHSTLGMKGMIIVH